MKISEMAALYAEDIHRIDLAILSSMVGSNEAAELIEAAGELSKRGVSVEEMIRRITPYAITARDRRIMEANRQAHDKKIDELVGAYQGVIDKFAQAMARIDHAANTYAKIRYEDVRLRPVRGHGESAKPNGYNREIEIDEIVLTGTGE